MRSYIIITASILCLLAVPMARANQVNFIFYPTGDTFLRQTLPNANQGLSGYLRIEQPTAVSHAVIKFSQSGLASIIGTKTIVGATLNLYVETNYNNWGSGGYVDVHRLISDWTEYMATIPPRGATWSCSLDTNLGNSSPDCAVQWSGGTYQGQATASLLHQNYQYGWKMFNVTTDVQLFMQGTANYGWLVRKRNPSGGGSVDYTSIQGNALTKPRLVVTVENEPPQCFATATPSPNSNGWNNSNVTVSCSCSDPDGCSTSGGGVVSTEGAGQVVSCHATDSLGATSDCSATVNLDKTAPSIEILSPEDYTILGSTQVSVTGTTADSLSGVKSVLCDGYEAELAGGDFLCEVPLSEGENTVSVATSDFAENSTQAVLHLTSQTGQSPLTIDHLSPDSILADGSDEDVYVAGTGFTENTVAFVDEQEVPLLFIDSTGVVMTVNFDTTMVHFVELMNGDSDPAISTIWERGLKSIRIDEILVDPSALVEPTGGSTLGVFGNVGTFESEAQVYLAPSGSACSYGLVPVQSVEFISDAELAIVSPAAALGSYELFVDNPSDPDFCQLDALNISWPPATPADRDARYWCCTNPVLPPPTMYVGDPFTVRLNVKNTGSLTWTYAEKIKLGSEDLGIWGVSRQTLKTDDSIPTNHVKTFMFEITAPSTAGTYSFSWQMIKEDAPPGQKWFGQVLPCSTGTGCSGNEDCSSSTCSGTMMITVIDPSDPYCGDGVCNGQETHDTCPQDCSADPYCGDGICNGQETNETCPSDCSCSSEGTNCPAACPDDNEPDTVALQNCLYELTTVTLRAGTIGYIIDDEEGPHSESTEFALTLKANRALRSSGTGACYDGRNNNPLPGNCAVIQASDSMTKRMLEGRGDDFVIDRMIFDGNGDDRRSALPGSCDASPGHKRPFSLTLGGPDRSGWSITNSVSMNAMCGSALRATGSDYTIAWNLLLNNGAHTSSSQPDPWADGITLLNCGSGATINNNHILDATDVGIAGGGTGSTSASCTIANNVIKQANENSFGGIGVASFLGPGNGNGNWGSSKIRGNKVNGHGLMDFGIHAGKHAWHAGICVDGGEIKNNSPLKKSFINLSVDGWTNGTLNGNTPSNAETLDPEGKMTLGNIRFGDNCAGLYPTDYTVADDGGTGHYENQSGTPLPWTMHYTPEGGGICDLADSDNCCCRKADDTCKTCDGTVPSSYYDDKEQ